MDIMAGIGILLFIVASLILLFVAPFKISTNLTSKKLAIGGTIAAALAAITLLLIRVPIESLVTGTLCFGILGAVFVLVTGVRNKLFARIIKSSSIQIKDVVITTDIDEKGGPIDQVSIFKQTNPRIYLFITHISLTGWYLGAILLLKIYYEGKEIRQIRRAMQARKPILIEIEAPKDTGFLPGHYTLEFFVEQINSARVKTVKFEVIEDIDNF